MTPILVQGACIYSSARLRFHNQDRRGGEGGLSYLDGFKLKKHCEIVMRSLRELSYRKPFGPLFFDNGREAQFLKLREILID